MWQDEARQALADAQAQLKEAGVLAKRAGDEALRQAEAAREAEEARKKAVGSFEVNWAALCDTQEKLAAAEARVVSLEELVRASESAGEQAPAGDTAAEVQALQAQLAGVAAERDAQAQAVQTYEAQLIKQGERLAALQDLEQEVAELRSGRGGGESGDELAAALQKAAEEKAALLDMVSLLPRPSLPSPPADHNTVPLTRCGVRCPSFSRTWSREKRRWRGCGARPPRARGTRLHIRCLQKRTRRLRSSRQSSKRS